ncbi:glutamine-hydrolyzing carbamoyl-phosphate synthase small subunit [symbiont of Argiope bruennichi]|uniref:glutamine-hydrolyzing carbamoyl-phosphate synthase small subunit n=1 Tax=symbiont of Argiope bruennichi TaxID=2810479 RepID=UPI003DA6B5BC
MMQVYNLQRQNNNTQKKAKIVLEDGKVFFGFFFGKTKESFGDLVFSTAMSGYQEILTDPSYFKQIIVLTFPEIGIYGVNMLENESDKIYLSGLIVDKYIENDFFNNFDQSFEQFLKKKNCCGVFGVDTRALTEYLRENGSKKCCITFEETSTEEVIKKLNKMTFKNHVKDLKVKKITFFYKKEHLKNKKKVLFYDLGTKKSILDHFIKKNYELFVVSWNFSFSEIKKINPDLIFLSNGPGDPRELVYLIEQIKKAIAQKYFVFGICLGLQIIGLALGFKIEKLKFGHHGVNHPIIDNNNKIFITSQNHDYVLIDDKKINDIEIIFRSGFDNSIEGIKSKNHKIFCVQFHPEANPGPKDMDWIFKKFFNYFQNE